MAYVQKERPVFGVQPASKRVAQPSGIYGQLQPRKGVTTGGGGGASGKMLYRPQVSQSRISVLRSMLGLPFLKRPGG